MSENLIYAVFDSSGSNLEMGKSILCRNLARTLIQLKNIHTKVEYANLSFELYTLNEKLQSVTVNTNGDIPAFKSVGSTDLSLFCNFITELESKEKYCPVMFFTDGNYKTGDIEALFNTVRKNRYARLMIIPVGLDADLRKMLKLKLPVFSADNILVAVDYAITYMFGDIDTPKSLKDILEIDEGVLFSKDNANLVEDSWD